MVKQIRFKFWLWLHDSLEAAWHWSYMHLAPLYPPLPPHAPVLYSKILENDEVTIYRTGVSYVGGDEIEHYKYTYRTPVE